MPKKMNPIHLLLAVLLSTCAGVSKDFPVADFGAKGDGKADDGPAIRKTVAAAVAAGAGSRVVFEKMTYRLDWCQTAPYQISVVGATNIAIEGNGAVLVSHPRQPYRSPFRALHPGVFRERVDCFRQQIVGQLFSLRHRRGAVAYSHRE